MGIVWVPLTIFGGPMSLGVPGKSPLTGYISMQGANKISWSINFTTSFCMKTSQISFLHLLSNHWWLLHKILQSSSFNLSLQANNNMSSSLPKKRKINLKNFEKLSRWELWSFPPPFFLMFRKPRQVGQNKKNHPMGFRFLHAPRRAGLDLYAWSKELQPHTTEKGPQKVAFLVSGNDIPGYFREI